MPFFKSTLKQNTGGSVSTDDYVIKIQSSLTPDGSEVIIPPLYSATLCNASSCSVLPSSEYTQYLGNTDDIIIGSKVIGCNNLLYNRTGYNGNIIFGDSAPQSCDYMLYRCSNFNTPINFYNTLSLQYALYGCTKFNRPVEITISSDSETRNVAMHGIFFGCTNFNQPLELGKGIIYNNQCRYLFTSALGNCTNFNSPINVYHGVTDVGNMLGYTKFNHDIVLPSTVNQATNLLESDKEFSKSVYFKGNNWQIAVDGLFHWCNNSKRKNVYFNSERNIRFNGTSWAGSIVGANVTWTSMTNGFYNVAFNVYCYYNYPA